MRGALTPGAVCASAARGLRVEAHAHLGPASTGVAELDAAHERLDDRQPDAEGPIVDRADSRLDSAALIANDDLLNLEILANLTAPRGFGPSIFAAQLDPFDPNLWPEAATPKPGFHEKDKVENYLHDQVCDGKITLKEAQIEIATNWLNVYHRIS